MPERQQQQLTMMTHESHHPSTGHDHDGVGLTSNISMSNEHPGLLDLPLELRQAIYDQLLPNPHIHVLYHSDEYDQDPVIPYRITLKDIWPLLRVNSRIREEVLTFITRYRAWLFYGRDAQSICKSMPCAVAERLTSVGFLAVTIAEGRLHGDESDLEDIADLLDGTLDDRAATGEVNIAEQKIYTPTGHSCQTEGLLALLNSCQVLKQVELELCHTACFSTQGDHQPMKEVFTAAARHEDLKFICYWDVTASNMLDLERRFQRAAASHGVDMVFVTRASWAESDNGKDEKDETEYERDDVNDDDDYPHIIDISQG